MLELVYFLSNMIDSNPEIQSSRRFGYRLSINASPLTIPSSTGSKGDALTETITFDILADFEKGLEHKRPKATF